MDNLRERNFEDDICEWLCEHGGYTPGDAARFDRTRALDVQTLLDFVRASQPEAWKKHEQRNPGRAEDAFIDGFCKEVQTRSLLEVLRRGFSIRGVAFRVVFWQPENALNPKTVALCRHNVLHCTRQLRYSPHSENSVDVALLVNGIPVICLELKNPLTGQTVEHAMRQFRYDRSPDDLFFAFKRRVLTCFAVDLYHVRMTTRLQGRDTVFLPFDQGSNGAGEVGGAGNPVSPDGDHATAYLWKRVLRADALLELLQKYLHLAVEEKKDAQGRLVRRESLIFPRYHQWDVLHKLLDDIRQQGTGRNYLIQHSAGSGKSNSIAWLAHHLSGLHDARNEKIFRSVIVITDRRVLDKQLQDSVGQFEQTRGLVCRVRKGSASLRDAINDGKAIIVTTLQKFSAIYREVRHTGRTFAVIVDEAHSSQTGRAALKVRHALADAEAALAEYAAEEGRTEELEDMKKDKAWEALAAQGTHANLSFFAFTATPKARTLQLFGQQQEDGHFRAFHIYSMRQAIEEGFILDVLRNYATWKVYFQLLRKTADDPVYATAAGARAALRFASLHPHNIAQKTAVMLDHFRTVTAHKMGGRAKAMLVTPSRLHAVRYMQEFDRRIRADGLTGIRPLVAFSGEVRDIPAEGRESVWTEEKLNTAIYGRKITEREVPDLFAKDFNILIVAEKYQTGFDQPLLHTMFVDKSLKDIKAVQTLSRLNRVAPGKEDTFVLDFVNSAEKIQLAFAPYYEATVLEQAVDPGRLYAARQRLDAFGVYTPAQVAAFGEVLLRPDGPSGTSPLAAAAAVLAPVLHNVAALPEEQRRAFRKGLVRFMRLYTFLSQIVRLFDEEMLRFFLFAKKLAAALPSEDDGLVNLDGQIDLAFYRLTKTGEQDIPLIPTKTGLSGIRDASDEAPRDFARLSDIVSKINQRFGTSFTPAEQVEHFTRLQNSVLDADTRLTALAETGSRPTWDMLYAKTFRAGADMASRQGSPAFHALLATPGALDLLGDLMKENVWQMAVARRRELEQGRGC